MTRTEEILCRFLSEYGVRAHCYRGDYFIAVKAVDTYNAPSVELLKPTKGSCEVVNLSEIARHLELERV